MSTPPGGSGSGGRPLDEPPPGRYSIAWRYLVTPSRMKRRASTLDVELGWLGSQELEIDVAIPADAGEDAGPTWFVPVAFLSKEPVAPDLRISDCGGAALAVPTKRENMALTHRAVEALADEGVLPLGPRGSKARALAHELICAAPFEGRARRLIIERTLGVPPGAPLLDLLGQLEDQFVLWVPVHGEPGSEHHISVVRQEARSEEQIRTRTAREELVPVDTAAGRYWIGALQPTGWPTIDVAAALDRILTAFALRPVEFRASEFEAVRFASYHLRVFAPEGFLVRNVRAARVEPAQASVGAGVVEELGDQPNAVVQGHDTGVAHVHLAEERNPRHLYARITLGLHGGMTTLWMLAALLTAGLIWLVYHHSDFGDPGGQNKQIAAGVLLVGPAFASAWALQADRGGLLRAVLTGARILLLGSAALSVATALALADVHPSFLERKEAIEWYAAAGYFMALPLLAAWLLSSSLSWIAFRDVLFSQRRNLAAILVFGVVALGASVHHGIPTRLTGLALVAAGLGLAAIAANSVAEEPRSSRAPYRPLAGVAAVPVFVVAGYFLGFYEGPPGEDSVRLVGTLVGAGIAVLATVFLILQSVKPQEGEIA